MKIAMQLTLDGLMRAMRIKAHEVADAMETRRPSAKQVEAAKEDHVVRRRGGKDDSGGS